MKNWILYGALKTLYLDDHFIPKVLDPLYTLVYLFSRNYSRALPLPYISQVVASGVISTTSIDIESHLQPVVSLLFSPSYVQVITLYPLTLFDVLSKRIKKNCVRVFFSFILLRRM